MESLVQDVLERAKRLGATAAEVEVSKSQGESISVRQGEVETLEFNQDSDLSLTVYVGQRKGNVSSTDYSSDAIDLLVEKAIAIARYTSEDPASGLPEEEDLAKVWPVPELFFPWEVPPETMIEMAKVCEARALSTDRRVTNSEGASISRNQGQFMYANSAGFMGGYPSSDYSMSCSVIAEDEQGMQRDYWYTAARNPEKLDTPESVGWKAAQRTVRRLGARKLSTQTLPVIFESPIAGSLIGHLVGAASGSSLYRKMSFLQDQLGHVIAAPCFNLKEDPFLSEGWASAPFDSEGVKTHARNVVENGVLKGYFLGSYSARKLGMKTTGNAGGAHNLSLQTTHNYNDLLKQMDRGLLITELMGQGVNGVTGDYSRGAFGFWVEDGVIQYPVEEFAIAGNLKEMYRQILGIGDDVYWLSSRLTGSILLGSMMIAGD
jgi:PmbA protein